MSDSEYLFEGPALRVTQPIGTFLLASVPWHVLKAVTYPDPLRLAAEAVQDPKWKEWSAAGELEGTQRKIEEKRLKEIAAFLRTFDATIPNAIILSVPEAGEMSGPSGDLDWEVSETERGCWHLRIPRGARHAVVVDGQHRLYAFDAAKLSSDREFDLVCSIFFALPQSMQAIVFATINVNQKPVRRGLAMNLYGYNLEDEEPEYWSPEKLAVFMSRRLNFKDSSPVHRAIRVEAAGVPAPELLPGAVRPITMASVVDGILGLIAKRPKHDRDTLKIPDRLLARRTKRRDLEDDGSPLRPWYTQGRDADLYSLLVMFFEMTKDRIWVAASDRAGMLTRSVGLRALFKVLARALLRLRDGHADPSDLLVAISSEWQRIVDVAARLRFDDPYFEATDRGRRRIELVIAVAAGLVTEGELPNNEKDSILNHAQLPSRHV